MSGRRKKNFPVFLWHRRLGLLAMVFVSILAVTGIALNHTESLTLDRRMLHNDWLLDWYGLNPKQAPISFVAGTHRITQWDTQIFFDNRQLMNSEQPLLGAVTVNQMIAAALPDHILLISEQGELIERIPTIADMGNITAIATTAERLLLRNSQQQRFQSDDQIVDWMPVNNVDGNWALPQTLPDELREQLKTVYRGNGLSMERVLLDLHSGRLFSADWGIYIMDASAVILLWLSSSGLWVWWSRKRKMQSKKHYRKHH